MYKLHFGLKENPFNMTPDPRFIYLSDQHEDALLQLIYGVTSKKGFLMVTGEVGTGKTTISRTLLEKLGDDVETALLLNPYLNDSELLKAIVTDFGITCNKDSMNDMLDALNKFLLKLKSEDKTAALIIDEAQNLPIKSMELIRMLSNLETNTDKLLQIVLIGQPELKFKLKGERLRQLNQRITIRTELGPLSMEDTKGYIAHRLIKAGSLNSNIFSSSAVREIFHFTKGYPRLINALCDRSLLCAYSFDKRNVDKKVVQNAATDVFENFKMKRSANYYKLAFYTMAVIFFITLSIPGLIDYYYKNIRYVDNFYEVDKRLAVAYSSEAPKKKAYKVVEAEPGALVNTTAVKADEAEAENSVRGEGEIIETKAEEETEADAEETEIEDDGDAISLDEYGRYFTENLNYSLEVSVMNLLTMWDADINTLQTIRNFSSPSATLDNLADKLRAKNINLNRQYKIVNDRLSLKKLVSFAMPAVVAVRDLERINSFRYALIVEYGRNHVQLLDPKKGPAKVRLKDFDKIYMNDAIIISKSPFTGWRTLKLDMTARDVNALENSLKDLGYFYMEPDNTFDEHTYTAVVKFQEALGMKPDGFVGTGTRYAVIKEINKELLLNSTKALAYNE